MGTIELLYSLKGTFKSIECEFNKIHDKIGINITYVKNLQEETFNVLDRDILEVLNKFKADEVPIGKSRFCAKKYRFH